MLINSLSVSILMKRPGFYYEDTCIPEFVLKIYEEAVLHVQIENLLNVIVIMVSLLLHRFMVLSTILFLFS